MKLIPPSMNWFVNGMAAYYGKELDEIRGLFSAQQYLLLVQACADGESVLTAEAADMTIHLFEKWKAESKPIAGFNRDLEAHGATQHLFKLSRHFHGYDWVIASTIIRPEGDFETVIFGANEKGERLESQGLCWLNSRTPDMGMLDAGYDVRY